MSRYPDLPGELLAADPAPEVVPDEAARLDTIRTTVDVRRHVIAPTAAPAPAPARQRVRRPRRRLLVLAGLTATMIAVPLAVVVIAPDLWSTVTGRLPGSAPGVDGAVADDGSLDCSDDGAYAAPIRPDRATTRLWPTTLPPGWRVLNVFARSVTGAGGWCGVPSLVAARTDQNGVVTGTISVTGPAQGIRADGRGERDTDRVDGHPAIRFGGITPESFSWLWTDGTGRQWFASVNGFPLAEAGTLMSAVGTRGTDVTWRADAAPELRVVHQRTGTPYPQETRTEDWYIRLHDGQAERMVEVRSGDVPPLTADVTIDTQLSDGSGPPELLGYHASDRPGVVTAVLRQPEPGVRVFSEVHDNLADVRTVLAGLRRLPADDPRLDTYALPE